MQRTYFDMDPWYLKYLEDGILDWPGYHQSTERMLLSRIVAAIRLRRPARILDAGCGGGNFTLEYATSEQIVQGFDYSKVAIELAHAKQNPAGVEFFEADALDLRSYDAGPFDLIVAKDLLHFIKGEDRKDLLENLACALTDSGTLFLSTLVLSDEKDQELQLSSTPPLLRLECAEIESEIRESGLRVGFFMNTAPGVRIYELHKRVT